MISITVEFPRVEIVSSNTYVKVIVFTATNGQNNYTVSDVADLDKMVGGTMVKVELDGSNLISGGSVLATWDDTNFTLSAFITVSGGERVFILYI